ncbi:Com family DNA-binding transcriptional regulator [Azospirillum sp. A39]|uniref:Com family DNA-binding transcriptional regulator n=1 Tax=Azospirillum sp. A39 TaxID=3462279 RepID=UPI004045C7A1
MEEIRCTCGALLARASLAGGSAIEIKCRRCGTFNHVRAASPEPERPRASYPAGDARASASVGC